MDANFAGNNFAKSIQEAGLSGINCGHAFCHWFVYWLQLSSCPLIQRLLFQTTENNMAIAIGYLTTINCGCTCPSLLMRIPPMNRALAEILVVMSL